MKTSNPPHVGRVFIAAASVAATATKVGWQCAATGCLKTVLKPKCHDVISFPPPPWSL